jgi:NADPH2:quinone reductase
MKAIRIQQYGGAEVLQPADVATPEPGKGEARVRLEAIGVNYIDIYHRTGLYPQNVPFTPGAEGAGIVDAVGPDVLDVAPGDRVAYAGAPGSYAEFVVLPAWKLVKAPEWLDMQQAAASMLQGMTVHYLVKGAYWIKPQDLVLAHAAAGGVGRMLVQAAKRLGAFVIGTAGNAEKAALAREAGADEVIIYTQQDFRDETKRITNGQGVHVVYDSVGQSTFERSLDCLRPRGHMVLFGQSSGPVAPFNPSLLAQKGSLFLTRPILAHYTNNREELLLRANEVFEWIRTKAVTLKIDSTFPLSQAGDAHRRLESRASAGKILLLPGA